MRRLGMVLAWACAFGLLVGGTNLAQAQYSQGGFKLEGKTVGHCELVNVDVGRELYDGTCKIKEKIQGSSVIYEIKLGSAQSFLFATSDGGRTWMHGPEPVRFRDLGHTGIFRWGAFRLEVDED